TAATCAIAASSKSSIAASSPLFEILITAPARPSSRRKAWSRSLPRSETLPRRPKSSAAIRAASSAVNRGGVESRTELTADRWYSPARRPAPLFGRYAAAQNPSFERNGSPFRGRIALRCPPTFQRLVWRLLRLVLRQRGGRDKEVHVGASLTKRDGSRFQAWQATLLAVLLVMALGIVRSGASWGSSAYDATSDPYSMQNMTAADG